MSEILGMTGKKNRAASVERSAVPPAQSALLALLAVAVLLSGWGPLYPRNTWLQLGPCVLLLMAAMPMLRRWPLGTASLRNIILFLLLHKKITTADQFLVPAVKGLSDKEPESEEIKDCLRRARFVGRWLARGGTPATLYALFGIRP